METHMKAITALKLPHRAIVYDDHPECDSKGDILEFRLTYEGELHPSTNKDPRASHKHAIRKVFHRQLKSLWGISPHLSGEPHPIPFVGVLVNQPHDVSIVPQTRIEALADNFPLGDYRFVPLVTEDLSLLCGIDILFLRPSPPGRVIENGDVDNRIKTLFDAFKRPKQMQEVGEYRTPSEDEKPFFFCLLEDDSLVSRVSVETDRLLQPIMGGIPSNFDARLIITVTIKPYKLTYGNLPFSA